MILPLSQMRRHIEEKVRGAHWQPRILLKVPSGKRLFRIHRIRFQDEGERRDLANSFKLLNLIDSAVSKYGYCCLDGSAHVVGGFLVGLFRLDRSPPFR
jgi:hypothetical protein